MELVRPFLDKLEAHARSEGGWGYGPGQVAQLEPTCYALLALSLDANKYKETIDKGFAFVAKCAAADGSYRSTGGREEAIWPTSLVLYTRATTAEAGTDSDSLRKTASFLLSARGQIPKAALNGELHDIDLSLTGWPWAENNFSWVEPTAWACLALRQVGQGAHARVVEGTKLLLDRAMDSGGINYGNRRILGKFTEPIPGPTALLLLATQPSQSGGATEKACDQIPPRIQAACQYLLGQIDCGDLDHLCWMKLALDIHRRQPGVEEALPKLDAAILSAHGIRQQISWLKAAPMRLALTALALATDKKNCFRLEPKHTSAEECSDKRRGSTNNSVGQRVGTWFRGLAVKAVGTFRQLPLNSAVSIAKAADYKDDLAGILQRQFEHFREHVSLKGKRVVLKPNLVEYHRDKVINTNPLVISAVIELCKREGAAEITVAEGPGHWRNVEYLVSASGLGDVLKQHGVPFVDINHDEPVKTPNLGRLTGLEYLYLSRTIATADVLISLPKLKTHHWAGATLSLKNLFGTLPGICYGWPKNELHWRGIDNSIVDIALTRTPELAIVDGIIGMEGDGPLNGIAKPFGALIMGHDLLAVDATCCRLMMLDPEKIAYLGLGHMKKLGRLGEDQIPQLGESIASLAQPFETVAHLNALRVKKSA